MNNPEKPRRTGTNTRPIEGDIPDGRPGGVWPDAGHDVPAIFPSNPITINVAVAASRPAESAVFLHSTPRSNTSLAPCGSGVRQVERKPTNGR